MSKGCVKAVMKHAQPFWSQKSVRLRLGLVRLAYSASTAQGMSIVDRHRLVYRPLVALLEQGPR